MEPEARLGAYRIVSPLGAGGMGEVCRAHDPKLGRDVAIKVLPEAMSADPERIARFEREARALATLQHPNIATDASEWGPDISHDGRWVAYTSDESGRYEICVRAVGPDGRPTTARDRFCGARVPRAEWDGHTISPFAEVPIRLWCGRPARTLDDPGPIG